MARRLSGSEERRAKLRQKIQNDVDNTGSRGKWKSILDLDQNVSWYKPVNTNEKTDFQTNKIDIIPFIIMSENHPDVRHRKGDSKVGDPGFDLDISYHRNMGVNEDTPVLCLAKTYEEKCPICEDLSRMYNLVNKDEEKIKKLKPKRRVYYNVIDKTNDEEISQVWDSSFYLFKEGLNNKLRILKAQGIEDLAPADWEDGVSICFNGKHRPGGDGYKDFTLCEDFSFEKRDYTYPDPASKEGKENAYCFDALMAPPTYEEVWEIYYGEKMGSAEEKDIPDHIAIRKPHQIDKSETPKSEEDTSSDSRCPGGYEFGADNQKHDMCTGSEIDGKQCDDDTFNSCEQEKLAKTETKRTRGSR